MGLSGFTRRILGWLGKPLRSEHSAETRHRDPLVHVIILDGTMSTLDTGRETHAGQTYRMMCEMGARVSVFYEAGVQWQSWRRTADVMVGRGINRQIRRAYGYLASRYKPGDKIFLMGYSRGAYGVRSLAGVIDMVGLLKSEHATVRNIRQAYRHYECNAGGTHLAAFRRHFCHDEVPIEMIGVWDTVKALGMRLPLLWRWAEEKHAFHSHQLGPSVRHGLHALALNETRNVFAPVLWESRPGVEAHIEQVWFRGTHGDVGGQLGGFEEARPLANVSLIWMLEQAEALGLPLPEGWQARFPADPAAPSTGTWRGWGKIFLMRKRRVPLQDPSERLHESVDPAQVLPAPPTPQDADRHTASMSGHAAR
ncbi:Uncharacterized alpha/beta hydrolase domain [Cribrihabitans marinus]|uniref:Uncharacterized alpha/beta hydrolase domain n=1 Tax=Cribrihabitans marinus TaxID=1227549 RepID=A0A1H7B114_9RHOB|nr:DUF2235 domain-containing protein [Cribrihabitans marinus]GGH32370.1 hypothetical protein GCM10010973_23790 [Cribrihabitans marinus]SEJ68072.1 Uncharacterized alpha/beta hydrolase domain [Cribrihabitans marinus]